MGSLLRVKVNKQTDRLTEINTSGALKKHGVKATPALEFTTGGGGEGGVHHDGGDNTGV